MTFAIINFLIFVGLLGFFLRKPFANFLKTRQAEIAKIMDGAKQLLQNEEDKLKNLIKEHDGLKKAVDDIQKNAVSSGKSEKEEIINIAKESAVRMKTETERHIEWRKKNLLEKIRKEAISKALALASRKLSIETTHEDKKKFLAKSLDNLKKIKDLSISG